MFVCINALLRMFVICVYVCRCVFGAHLLHGSRFWKIRALPSIFQRNHKIHRIFHFINNINIGFVGARALSAANFSLLLSVRLRVLCVRSVQICHTRRCVRVSIRVINFMFEMKSAKIKQAKKKTRRRRWRRGRRRKTNTVWCRRKINSLERYEFFSPMALFSSPIDGARCYASTTTQIQLNETHTHSHTHNSMALEYEHGGVWKLQMVANGKSGKYGKTREHTTQSNEWREISVTHKKNETNVMAK